MGNASSLYTGRSEDIAFFLQNARKYKVLSKEEEQELFKIVYGNDKKKAIDARNLIIASNQLYVYSIAKSYTADVTLLPDLILEGMSALVEWFDRYNPETNTKFITFAKPYVMRAVHNFVYKTNAVVYRHEHIMATVGKIKKYQERYCNQNGFYPSEDEISEYLESIGERSADLSIYGDYNYTSTDTPLGTEDGCDTFADSDTFASFTASTNDVENVIEQEDIHDNLMTLMECLSEREKDIVMKSYGIGYSHPKNDMEIALDYGLTTIRIQQIRKSAFEKMRKAA